MTELRIAPARTRDELTTFLAIGRAVHPGPKPSVDGLEHELATNASTVFLLAWRRAEAVGAGVGKTSSIGDAYSTMARVPRAHRRAGVGTALLAALSERARTAGRGSLIGRLREDDDEARRFVEGRGFEELSHECPVALDLARFDAEPRVPPGVEIVCLAERPDLMESRVRGSLDRPPGRPRRIRGAVRRPVRRVAGRDRRGARSVAGPVARRAPRRRGRWLVRARGARASGANC